MSLFAAGLDTRLGHSALFPSLNEAFYDIEAGVGVGGLALPLAEVQHYASVSPSGGMEVVWQFAGFHLHSKLRIQFGHNIGGKVGVAEPQ